MVSYCFGLKKLKIEKYQHFQNKTLGIFILKTVEMTF